MKTPMLFIMMLLSFQCYAQKMPDYGLYNVRISDTAHSIHTQVNPVALLPKPEPGVDYYWLGGNVIHQQQGGYSGKLLNGVYEEYYKNKNLKTQGAFVAGLKNGLWKSWTENGRLTQEVSWDNGRLTGKFSLYDAAGREIQSGYYADGLKEGRVRMYEGTDSARQVMYKHGNVVIPKKNNFLRRINVFKRKTVRADSLAKKQ